LTHTLQHATTHTATHCNTLQHTATHCNTLQHTATHCNTLQHTAAHCNTVQHTLQYIATHCNTHSLRPFASGPIMYASVYMNMHTYMCCYRVHANVYPPKNGEIALWPNTRVVKCKYCVSQKQNGFNNNVQWYIILLTFILKFTARLLLTKTFVLSNLSNCRFTTSQH